MSYAFKPGVLLARPRQTQVLIAGRPALVRRRGMGDALSDAQAALTAAGYRDVSCRTERVSLPMADPTTGRNYYDQNVCSAAGHTGAFMADVVNRGGVDLAAERRALERAGGGDDTSYFDGIGRGSTPLRYAYDPLPPGNILTQVGQQSTNPNAPPARAVTVSLENTSRPGQAMTVGDNWTLRISGTPNSDVKASAQFNGAGGDGETNFGKTDSQGLLTIRGQFKAAEVGQWRQKWTVNGMSASHSFTVMPKQTQTAVDGGPERIMCPQVAKRCADGSVVGYDPAISDRCVYLPCPESRDEKKRDGDGNGGLDIDLSGLVKNPMVWVAAAGALLLLGGRR